MGEILAGEATPAQIAGFAVALRAKGETVEEVAGLVDAMCRARRRRSRCAGRLLDVVGTGGDRSMSVNISTMAAIVAAGAGRPGGQARQPVGVVAVGLGRRARGARHPARPAARRGSPSWPTEVGITFCFAAAFHPAMRHAAVPRRELGIATTFNFLGPLANPARPAAQAIGCADARMAPVMAGVFARRGVDAWVFRGDDGLDELTTTTTSLGVGGHATARSPSARVDPAALRAGPRRPPRTCAAATPRTTPRSCAACWPARPGRCATPCCSTPAPRWRSHEAATRPKPLDEALAGGIAGRPRRSTPARRGRCWTAGSRRAAPE